jgi:hypothetical protein
MKKLWILPTTLCVIAMIMTLMNIAEVKEAEERATTVKKVTTQNVPDSSATGHTHTPQPDTRLARLPNGHVQYKPALETSRALNNAASPSNYLARTQSKSFSSNPTQKHYAETNSSTNGAPPISSMRNQGNKWTSVLPDQTKLSGPTTTYSLPILRPELLQSRLPKAIRGRGIQHTHGLHLGEQIVVPTSLKPAFSWPDSSYPNRGCTGAPAREPSTYYESARPTLRHDRRTSHGSLETIHNVGIFTSEVDFER